MKQKSIIIVSAGTMQVPAIKIARETGLHVIATDKNPDAPGFAYADLGVALDTKDVDGHVALARELSKKYNIAGAFAAADVAVTVAAITEALGLPGISLEVAKASNNKAIMKQKFFAAGVPTPESKEITSLTEAEEMIELWGLPVIVKAVDSAASRGVKKIEDVSELADALADAKRHSSTGTALIEKFYAGTEQSVETVVYDGVHYRCGVVDRHFGFQPYLIETGHTNPSMLPDDVREELYRITGQAANALGIAFGPAKSDTILTEKGPMILEMAARLSGGFHSQYTTPLALGMNVIKAVIDRAVGNPPDIGDLTPRHRKFSVCKAIFPKPGKVAEIRGIEKAGAIPGVEQIFLFTGVGQVIRPYLNCANRVCYIITAGETLAEAEIAFEQAARTIIIETA